MTICAFRAIHASGKPGGSYLVPADNQAYKLVKSIVYGDIVLLETKKARNPQHHRKMWALISRVHENLPDDWQEIYPTPEKLMLAIKFDLGLCTITKLASGHEIYEAGSISFANMDQGSFNEFYEKAIRLVCDRLLPGIDDAALRAEIAAEIR